MCIRDSTYGNQLSGDTQQELSVLGKELAMPFWLDFSNRNKAFSELLKFHMNCSSITLEEIGRMLGLTRERIRQIERKALEKLRGMDTIGHLKELIA